MNPPVRTVMLVDTAESDSPVINEIRLAMETISSA